MDGIENRSNTNLRIAAELTDVVEFLIQHRHIPGGPAIKTPDLLNRCPEASYYRLRRLHNEMGMVNKFTQAPKTLLIHTRLNEIVLGQNVSQMVNEELQRVVQHANTNPTIRQVVAAARSVPLSQALHGIFNGGFEQRRSRLQTIVASIRNDPRVSQGNYGTIIFRRQANQYRASPLALQLY